MNLESRETLFAGWEGCTDGYCIVRGKAKGMHTNGGCRCLVNASRSQLTILQSRLGAILYSQEKALTEGETSG